MLNQITGDFFAILLSYTPTFLAISLDIIILVFAIFIYKRNSYRYGIYLMMFSILSLIDNILYISIQYQDLWYRLVYVIGVPLSVAIMIIAILGVIFFALNLTSTIFLIVSIYQIYKTHKKDRIE